MKGVPGLILFINVITCAIWPERPLLFRSIGGLRVHSWCIVDTCFVFATIHVEIMQLIESNCIEKYVCVRYDRNTHEVHV